MEADCYPTLSLAVPSLESLIALLGNEDVVNPAGLAKKPYGYPCIPSDVIRCCNCGMDKAAEVL